MKVFIKKLREEAGDALFPENYKCAYCGREIFGGRLCSRCARRLTENNGATCPVCGRRTKKNEICLECKAHAPEYEKAVSPFVYEKLAVALIKKFKKGGAFISSFFAEKIYASLSSLPQADCIVFVPMTARAEHKRGYNQSRLIAEKLSALSGVPVLYGALEKVKETPQQKSLSRSGRIKNLQGCFKADKALLEGKSVLIIDDVTTTGATLDCAAAVIKKAGATHVYAATAASVEYKPAYGA